ncbi:MAG: hypothetical protein N2515_05260 [Deltaproteobacteria bacterium]|nr:hypothetical protein [Deltaproteobacteria bacterium]
MILPLLRFPPFEGKRGRASVEFPADGVVSIKASGHADLEMIQYIIHACEAAITRSNTIEIFHDLGDLQSQDPQARDSYLEWGERRRPHIFRSHVFVRSPMVAAALAIARLKLDYVVGYTDASSFEAAKREAIFRRLEKKA